MIFPYIVMHLEMQSRKYHLLDLEILIISVYNIISYIQNHGSTFIFDRGKKNRIYLLLQISGQLYIQILKWVILSKLLVSQKNFLTQNKAISRNTLSQLIPSSRKSNKKNRNNPICIYARKVFTLCNM